MDPKPTDLDPYGRPYPDASKLVPRTAADALVLRKSKTDGEFEILLITRKKPGPS